MYRENGKLCGVGYVDGLKCGLSAIYFFHDPNLYSHGLGIWNVMTLINEAKRRAIPHVYMGYYVKGCQSLEYKAGFKPNEILSIEGKWIPYC
jgi:arginine-tRNA-protein transferase